MSLRESVLGQRTIPLCKTRFKSSEWTCLFCQQLRSSRRLSTSARARQEQHQSKGPFRARLRSALGDTKVHWKYRIPVGLGIGFLGAVQFYRVQKREKSRYEEERNASESSTDSVARPEKRKRIRPSGPW